MNALLRLHIDLFAGLPGMLFLGFMGSQPLHFGDYGGMPMKVIWAILDVITIVVLASGLYLWIKKRRLSVADALEESTASENSATRSTRNEVSV
jgi:uncharacterized iron-regulated membrane protein